MARADGKRVKNLQYFDALIPHIMDKRVDSTNYVKDEFDITELSAYLRRLRNDGVRIGVMDFMMASIAQTILDYPVLSRFIVNKKVYMRNYNSISLTVLKRVDKTDIKETVIKIYFEQGDDLLSITKKIEESLEENTKEETQNRMDRFINKLMGMPLIPGALVRLIKFADRHGFLPKSIVGLSPFHTTVFVSNMGSINMSYVYHHLYEFGTTSLFMTMGKPKRIPFPDDTTHRIMPVSFSIDERICPGAGFAKCLADLKKYMEHPHTLQDAMKSAVEQTSKIAVV